MSAWKRGKWANLQGSFGCSISIYTKEVLFCFTFQLLVAQLYCMFCSVPTKSRKGIGSPLHIRPCSWRYTHKDCWHKMTQLPRSCFRNFQTSNFDKRDRKPSGKISVFKENCIPYLLMVIGRKTPSYLLSYLLIGIVFHTYWWWLGVKHQVTY